MKDIVYIVGDATIPQGDGNKFIIHVCNDIGAWGAGFVIALSKKWPITKKSYQEWKKKYNGLTLGTIQTVRVEKDIIVINMIGQRDIKTLDGVSPIRYGSIKQCLEKVANLALKNKASIHAPRFGSGLAGGDWNKIEQIIKDELSAKDIPVTIYDLPEAVTPKPIDSSVSAISAIDLSGLFDE